MTHQITVTTTVNAAATKAWAYYTTPAHITNWNFAHPSWCCPTASNDMEIGGIYRARMEARDGSFGFDFEAVYTNIVAGKAFTYEFGGRSATITFNDLGEQTEVIVAFDPETEIPQRYSKAAGRRYWIILKIIQKPINFLRNYILVG